MHDMTPTDDVALPELSDEQKERCREILSSDWEPQYGDLYQCMREGIAIGLADRARASERSTAEPDWEAIGREGKGHNADWCAGWNAHLVKTAHASPPASDAALERAEQIEAFKDAATHLIAAASAYRTYAKRHSSAGKAEVDAMFTTRANDFDNAAARAQAAYRNLMQPTATDETEEAG